jgi:hypothetical protein
MTSPSMMADVPCTASQMPSTVDPKRLVALRPLDDHIAAVSASTSMTVMTR